MITGTIGPKGRPGFLHPHRWGCINLVGSRTFVVDERPEAVVVDKDNETLVLPTEVYNDIRAEIAAGAAMFVEPLASEDDELAEADRAIKDLLRGREEDRDRFDRAHSAAVDRIEQLEADLRASRAAEATATKDLATASGRIAELVAQLAAAPATDLTSDAKAPAAKAGASKAAK